MNKKLENWLNKKEKQLSNDMPFYYFHGKEGMPMTYVESSHKYAECVVDLDMLQLVRKELEEKDEMTNKLESKEQIIQKSIFDDIKNNPNAKPLPMSVLSEMYCKEMKALTDEERQYLKHFLKPFKNEVEFITKNKVVHADDDSETNFEYLYIMLHKEYIQLPMFEKGTMYKNMELGKEYTLDELGIIL